MHSNFVFITSPSSNVSTSSLNLFLLCIIHVAEISTVICDKPEKAKVLLDNVERQKTLTLKRVILMDPFDVELVEQGKKCGVYIQALKDIEVCKHLLNQSLDIIIEELYNLPLFCLEHTIFFLTEVVLTNSQ